MELHSGVLLLASSFLLVVISLKKTSFKLGIFLSSLLGLLTAGLIPLAIISLVFFISPGSTSPTDFGKKHWLGVLVLMAVVEEFVKLLIIVFFNKFSNDGLNFFTRTWVGVAFGLCESALKFSYFILNSSYTFETIILVFSSIGLHGLTCWYPNHLRMWQTLAIFTILCTYHTLYNILILHGGKDGTLWPPSQIIFMSSLTISMIVFTYAFSKLTRWTGVNGWA